MYLIKKYKLQKGRSFPLQTSDIEKALDPALYDTTALWYVRGLPEDIMDVSWRLDNPGYNKSIHVYDIPSICRKQLRETLKSDVLPVINDWLIKARGVERFLSVFYKPPVDTAVHIDNQWPTGLVVTEKKKVLFRLKDFCLEEIQLRINS